MRKVETKLNLHKMTLKDFLNNSNQVLETISSQNELIEFIIKISSFNEEYQAYYGKFRNCLSGNANTTQQQVQTIINEIKKLESTTLVEIRKYRPYTIVIKLQELKIDLQKTIIFNDKLEDFLENDIQKLIDFHTDAYSEKKFEEIFSFVSYSKHFLDKLNNVIFATEIFLKNLELEPIEIPEQNQLLEIQILYQLDNLENFSSFLVFLDKMYQDMCKAFVIHYEDFPLRIIKIESGSVWTKLFGNKELIQLIKDFIFGIAGYIRDWQTGKIKKEQFENKVEQAGLVLDLITKAKVIGLKEENQVLLEKTFGQAVTNLSKSLPNTTTEIILDNKKLLNLNTKEIKAIEGRQILMLNSKNEKPNED